MTDWAQFAVLAPALASFGKQRLELRLAYLATIRTDGSPRVHPVSPFLAENRLFVYMEPTSPKGHDLRRDPRYCLHCAVEDNSGGQGEFLIRGQAVEVKDRTTREQAFDVANAIGYNPQERYILFELSLDEAVMTVYEDGEPERTRWKNGLGQESILHLQVTLEVGDYFRYYLDTIKMKMVIAAVIYALVAASLISFFAFIGEQEMLLKTSPLFLGFPALAIVGQLLRAHALTRKYIAGLSEAERVLKFSFRNDSSGYDVVRGDNFSHIAWSSIRSVVEKPRYFEFHPNKYDSFIIPRKFFASALEEEFLRKILRSQLGGRANLK